MRVKLTRETDSEGIIISLTMGKEYEVLAIEGDYYRILTDTDSKPYGNDPVLFERTCFEVSDSREPEFWVTEYFEGERYSGAFVWTRYFFEDYHDGKNQIRNKFKQNIQQYYPWTWNERFSS